MLKGSKDVFAVFFRTPERAEKSPGPPLGTEAGVVHRNPHEQVFLWITLWISG